MALVLVRSSLGGNVEWAIIELSKQLGELYHLLQSRRCNQNLFYFCWSFGHVRWWFCKKKSPSRPIIHLFLGRPGGPVPAVWLQKDGSHPTPRSFICGKTQLESLSFPTTRLKLRKFQPKKFQLFWNNSFSGESSWRKNAHTLDNTPCWIGNIWGTKSANSMTSRFRNFGVAPTHHVLFAKPFDVLAFFCKF